MSVAPHTWRMEYEQAYAQVIEWFVATNYGIGHFKIRSFGGKVAQILTQTEQKTVGWLGKTSLQDLRRHHWLKKMYRTAADQGLHVASLPHESIEALEDTWKLGCVFQHDLRARNAWSMLTGHPVGKSFEQIAAEANVRAAQQLLEVRTAASVSVIERNDSWGIF